MKKIFCMSLFAAMVAASHAGEPTPWAGIEQHARGQTVSLLATVELAPDSYIEWVTQEVKTRFGIGLVVESGAKRVGDAPADLLWISSEGLTSLQPTGELLDSWADSLPNSALLLESASPASRGYTPPAKGMAIPWGEARLTFLYDAWGVIEPPSDPAALIEWIQEYPRRFTYPQPQDPVGSSFLQDLLVLLAEEPSRLKEPVGDDFAAVSAPLWAWLEQAHPHLWRLGWAFPASSREQLGLVDEGQIDWALTLDPHQAARLVAAGELPKSIRTLQFAGTPEIQHVLAIPSGARAPEGARVVANFLLSPEAQARKMDAAFWGDTPEIALETRSAAEPALPRPAVHGSWREAITKAWQARYGKQ